MIKDTHIWDVAVIGGGPAGMMAAGRAAELGAKVILIEKNDSLGRKLLITGGGRCNVTNAEFDTKVLLGKYKDAGKFLASPFSQWNVQESLDFFHARKMPTKMENEKRVFPVSNSAQSVWDVLVDYLKAGKVTMLSKSPVIGFVTTDEKITAVQLKDKTEIRAKSFILATGGLSHPETGSTGDGFKWLAKIGHTVNTATAALVPIKTKDAWVKRLAGVSLKGAKITVFQNNTKQDSRIGNILFTHVGLSGPGILNMSSLIGELLEYGEVHLEIDTLPALDYAALNTRLQELLKEHHVKKIRNGLSALIPSALVPVAIELAQIDPDTPCHSITRAQRLALEKVLKHLPVQVDSLLGLDKAIITSGGVKREEVDFKTMQSRLYDNLYLVGDILDIDRPSGGYSLQLCWTTGFVAGSNTAHISKSASPKS